MQIPSHLYSQWGHKTEDHGGPEVKGACKVFSWDDHPHSESTSMPFLAERLLQGSPSLLRSNWQLFIQI